MTYSYHPHAQRELDDAADYYDAIDLELGDGFLEEVDGCISHSHFSSSLAEVARIGEAMQNTPFSIQPRL